MNNVLLMLGALLVGILAALVAVPMMIDWNGYRGAFEEEASRLMGRDVRLGGGVNVRILPVPYVRFEKLRIADLESTGGDPLFRAESVTMRLSVAPLLRGVFEAKSVELKKPALRLVVDAQGRGNWRSLTLTPGSLPFLPGDVSLQSVEIEGGTLVIAGPSGKELAQFDQIDGELSADGIEGPYKFKGLASWYGEAREFRIATGKSEADGSARVRASVRLPSNQNTYNFDGRLVDLKGKPRIDGDLTAKLPISAGRPGKPAAEGDANAFELKAKVSGDMAAGQLSDIALSLDQPGDPQLITGLVKAAWGEALRFDMALASRSFNLDRLVGDRGSVDPLDTMRAGLNVILAALPAEAETDAVLKADRVTLAGEPVTGVAITVNRRAGTLEIKDLKALLPGATRLEASGTINRDAKSASGFTGPVSLRGANLARFLAWAKKPAAGAASPASVRTSEALLHGRFEGPFAVEGQLAMSGGTIELTGGLAEVAGLPLSGELRYSGEGRRRIAILMQGQRFDAAQLWPGGFDAQALRAYFAGAPVPGEGSGLFGYSPDAADLRVEVRAAEVQLTPAINLRDVDTAFSVERGKVAVPRMRFATAAGLTVDLDGQLAGLSAAVHTAAATAGTPAGRRGTVRWFVNAPNPQAAGELINAIDWPASGRPTQAAIAALTALGPLRLAGSTTIGERLPAAIDVALDGTVDGGRFTATVRLDQGLANWRTAPLDIMAMVESGNVEAWLDLAGLRALPRPGRSTAPRPGQAFIKVEGQPQSGVTAMVGLTSDTLALVYQGTAANPKPGEITLDGVAGLTARDAADAFALAGLTLGQGAAGVPLAGQIEIKLAGGALRLASNEVKLAGATLRGQATVTPGSKATDSGAPAARELEATIAADQLSLPGLLLVLADRGTDASVAQPGAGARSVWPDRPLTFAGLDGLRGRVKLSAGRVALEGGSALSNAQAVIAVAPGSVTVGELSASGLGGQLKGTLVLEKAPAGARLAGDWTLTGASLSSLGASAPADFNISVKAQGLSPSGLVAALEGKGEAALGAGKVKAVAPGAVAAIVEGVLAGKVPPAGEDLVSALRLALASSTLDVAPRIVPFTISEGIARAPGAVFATAGGRASFDGTIDLNLMRFSTDWRIEANAKPGVTGKPKAPLPAIVVSTAGPIANMAEADTKLVTAAFEQEVSVRKLERDVEELERLRRLDEERRLQEDADRQKAEAARAAAAAAAEQADQAARVSSGGPPAAAPSATSDAGLPAVGLPLGTSAPVSAAQPAAGGQSVTPPAAAAPASVAPPPATPEPAGRASGLTRQPLGNTSRRRAQESFPQPLQNNF